MKEQDEQATAFNRDFDLSKRDMSDDFDHDSTDEIVCPYCGYEFLDSFETLLLPVNGEQEAEIRCYSCKRVFLSTATFSVSDTTAKKTKTKD